MFGCVKLTKNANPDKKLHSVMVFDTRGYHSLLDGSVGKYVNIFWVDMSLYVHIDNKGKDILALGKGPKQELNLTAETWYSVNFTRPGIKLCLSLHYNGSNAFLFANATKI